MTDLPQADLGYPPAQLVRSPLPRREHIWVEDLAGIQVAVLTGNLDELEHDERLANSETLSFTVRGSDPKASHLAEDVVLKWRGRRFYVTETLKRRAEGGAFIEITAEATWGKLADFFSEGSFVLFGITARAGLRQILALATGWTLIDPAVVDNVTTWYLEASSANVLDLLRQWAKITGYEIVFDTEAQTVAFVEKVGTTRGVSFRYGRNVTNVERRARPPEATRLFMYGRNNLTISGINPSGNPYVEDFTFYTAQGLTLSEARARFTRSRSVTDTTFTSDEDLYTEALRRIALLAQPRVQYQMGVIDLGELTGLDEDRYTIGDTVRVTDELLGYDLRPRIVRVIRRPLDPARSEIELSFLDGTGDDPRQGSNPSTTQEWILFEARKTTTPRRIRNGSTILARLDLTTIPEAEWVAGYSLAGIGVGTGTITVTVLDDITAETLFPSWTIPVIPGAQIRESFTFGEKSLDARARSIVVRAVSSGPGIGLDIDGVGNALWVLAKGTIQREIRYNSSQLFTYTGAVATFAVPDDITEVRITAVGAPGGATTPAEYVDSAGATVRAKFSVLGGSLYDVRVGGTPASQGAGWPNGGSGDLSDGGSNRSFGGGGSSDVRAVGQNFAAALLVASGGGGFGFTFNPTLRPGGKAGFFAGTDGGGISSADPGAKGATQDAGGAGGFEVGYGPGPFFQSGISGTAGQGGAAGDTINAFAYPGGGGGGGWFGGGGAGAALGSGLGSGGGGGGSGWIGSTGYDWEYTDGDRTEQHGYVLIEWNDPNVV